jgi:AcrR family transcriptional regulator
MTARTRALVVLTAREHFTQNGYEGAHIRDIAMAIGRSTGAIFCHFTGKAALWEAAMGSPAPDVRGFLAQLPEPAAKELLTALYGVAS